MMDKAGVSDALLGRRGSPGGSLLTMEQAFVRILFRACELDARSIECGLTSDGLWLRVGNAAAAEALGSELRRDLPWPVTVR